MVKKMVCVLVFLATVLGLLGSLDFGVRTASAAPDYGAWRDARPGNAVDTLAVPYFNSSVNLSTAAADPAGDLGGCPGIPSFGGFQLHAVNTNTFTQTTYAHVHVESTGLLNATANSWVVRLSRNDTGLTELYCSANAPGGVMDAIVAIPAGSGFVLTLSSLGAFNPAADPFVTWITQSTVAGGGLIVDMRGDAGNVAGRAVQASAAAGAAFQWGVPDTNGSNVFFLDLPAGSYNLGIQDQSAGAGFVAYYPAIAAPGIKELTPDTDAIVPLHVIARTETGANLVGASIRMTPNASWGRLNRDLSPGSTDALGGLLFRVNTGYLWDVALFRDGGPGSYFPYELAINPTGGTLIFDLGVKVPARVRLCTDVDYDAAWILLDPPGQLNPQEFNLAAGLATCPAGTWGDNFYLSAGRNYQLVEAELQEANWFYTYRLTASTWNFPAGITQPAYDQVIGDVPFLTGPDPATSQVNYTLPLPAGEVALLRGPWTDQDGNTLLGIVDDSGADPVVKMPEYWLETVSTPAVLLANDWETSSLGPTTKAGRYRFWRRLAHGNLTQIGDGGAGFFAEYGLFSINPLDVPLGGHWSWPWVMAMYEMDLTQGLDFDIYGVEQPVTRAQMATFLSRVMNRYGLLPNGVSAPFSDVQSGYWAIAAIRHLRDHGITGGCGGNYFCPELSVTRAEMAKFIELTFQTIHTVIGIDFYWDERQNVLLPGSNFPDVPQTHWANLWIEELLRDGLTNGCSLEEMLFCPEQSVTRGQMAKFIVRSIQLDSITNVTWGPEAGE